MKKPEISVSADELAERIRDLASRLSEAVDLAEKAGLDVRVTSKHDYRSALSSDTRSFLTVKITKKFTY